MAKRKSKASRSTASRSTANTTSMDDDNISTSARSRRTVAPVMDESDDDVVSETPRRASRSLSNGGNKNMWKDLVSNPAVRYVAGGIATAILTKVASNFSTKYPEISRFITENLDGVEGRLSEFKNSLNNDSLVNRH